VVDAATGEPVPGAAVTVYHSVGLAFTHGGAITVAERHARTDAEGRFAVPGTLHVMMEGGGTSAEPRVSVAHPEYGWASVGAGKRPEERLHVQVRLDRAPDEIEDLLEATDRSCWPVCPDSFWWSCLGNAACVERRAR